MVAVTDLDPTKVPRVRVEAATPKEFEVELAEDKEPVPVRAQSMVAPLTKLSLISSIVTVKGLSADPATAD